jgi:hypothetical protein
MTDYLGIDCLETCSCIVYEYRECRFPRAVLRAKPVATSLPRHFTCRPGYEKTYPQPSPFSSSRLRQHTTTKPQIPSTDPLPQTKLTIDANVNDVQMMHIGGVTNLVLNTTSPFPSRSW